MIEIHSHHNRLPRPSYERHFISRYANLAVCLASWPACRWVGLQGRSEEGWFGAFGSARNFGDFGFCGFLFECVLRCGVVFCFLLLFCFLLFWYWEFVFFTFYLFFLVLICLDTGNPFSFLFFHVLMCFDTQNYYISFLLVPFFLVLACFNMGMFFFSFLLFLFCFLFYIFRLFGRIFSLFILFNQTFLGSFKVKIFSYRWFS